MQTLPLHTHIVPNALVSWDHGIACGTIQSHGQSSTAVLSRVRQVQYAILHVESRIFREGFGNDEHRLRICLHTQFRSTLRRFDHVLAQVHCRGQFERPRSRHDGLVLNGIFDGAQPVPHGILDLINGMHVRTLQQQRTALGMPALLHEGEFIISQRDLAHLPGPTQLCRVQILHRMDGRSSARQRQPFHVPALRTAQAQDALLGKDIQR
mmetsp:Transcript_34221/g.58102  ORF Transcript_34221/g.58102 Transcript_34221/m.58102 type:complete len:210 (-) Transcript_34221:449-1078(-)